MPDSHAHLSPSAASRWIHCPASVRLEDEYWRTHKEKDSPFALEGTLAHSLAEIKARDLAGHFDRDEYLDLIEEWNFEVQYQMDQGLDLDPEKMDQDTDKYVEYIRSVLDEIPDSTLLVEQRVDTGLPECWGTGDAIIVSPDNVTIIDLKYGMGVRVSAQDNPQLQLYGVGALESYGDLLGDPKSVTMTIFQPRLGSISSVSMDAGELREWRDSLIPIAKDALAGSKKFGPSEDVCRWCPVAGDCRARMKMVAETDFSVEPDLLTLEEMGAALERIPMIKSWCSAVEASALEHAYTEGEHIPGFKVVSSGGRRYIKDPPATVQFLIDHGYTAEQVAELRIKTLGAIQKLIGNNKKMVELLGDQIAKTDGRPSLVKESDPRRPISSTQEVAADFEKED